MPEQVAPRTVLNYRDRLAIESPARVRSGLARRPFDASWASGDGGAAAAAARARLAEIGAEPEN